MHSNILKPVQWIPLFFACGVSLLSYSASANNSIGQVIFTTGSVRAVNDGEVRVLRKGSKVHEGDVVKSSRFGRSQIRMKDGALIALRPGSEFGFNEYQYDEEDNSNNSSVLSLIKGGFRTISGLIGKAFKQNYKVRTAVATIGIRGTHYGLTICQQGDCNTDDKDIEDGLYGSVIDGEVSAKNDSGEFVFSNDEFFHVESIGSQPRGLIKPPGVVFAQYNSEEALEKIGVLAKKSTSIIERRLLQQANVTGALAASSELLQNHIKASFETTEDIDLDQVNINPIGPNATTPSSAGQVMSLSYYSVNVAAPPSGTPGIKTIVSDGTQGNQFLLNSADLVGNLLVPVTAVATNGSTQHYFDLAGGTIQDSNSVIITNTSVNVGWGRWSQQYASVVNSVVEPHVGQLHYIVSTDSTSRAQLGGLTGTANYTTVGGTRATDLMGNVAANPANVSMTVTFGTTSTIDTFNISTTVGGAAYEGAIISPVSVSSPVMTNLNLSGGNACSACSGQANLTFFGVNAEGAGTVYTIDNSITNTQINGASVLESTIPVGVK